MAARGGRPAAFATFVEHWDPHLRRFVHLTLGQRRATDTVLMTAYLRAYRSLSRFRADQTPGLWLHRIAFGAVVDEVRRRNRTEAGPRPSTDRPERRFGADPDDPLGRLPLDQRALLLMIDHEGFTIRAVADAFGSSTTSIDAALGLARTALVAAAGDAVAAADPAGTGTTHRPGTDEAVDPERRGTDPAGILGRARTGRRPVPTSPQPPSPDDRTRNDRTSNDRKGGDRAPDTGTEHGRVPGGTGAVHRDDPFTVPSWMSDESVVLHVAPPTVTAPPPPGVVTDEQARAREILDGLEVPAAEGRFWARLGRILLDERSRQEAAFDDAAPPASGSGDRSAPAAAAKRTQRPPPPSSIVTIADRAERTRPRRRWGPAVAISVIVVAVVAAVVGAIVLGVSEPVPDGTTTAASFAEDLSAVFDSSPILVAQATVEDPREGGPPRPFEVTVASSGSWSVRRTDAFEVAAYDATAGTSGRFTVAPGEDGGPNLALAATETGVAAGPPDATLTVPEPVAALREVGPLLRASGDRRLVPRSEGGADTWRFRRRVAGPGAATEQWLVVFGRDDALPRLIQRRDGDGVTSRITFSSWKPASDLEDRSFDASPPPGTPTASSDHSFVTTDLAAVPILGRGQAITPTWLPDGFELATVTVRGEAPFGSEPTGSGRNPPDVGVASVAYQRGPERITVSTRDAGGREGDWIDPFAPVDGSTTRTRTLGDGRYNRVRVQLVTEPSGRGHLWTVAEDTVITVGGDLTSAEALRVASSLR